MGCDIRRGGGARAERNLLRLCFRVWCLCRSWSARCGHRQNTSVRVIPTGESWWVGRDEPITAEARKGNNKTMVLAIPWYWAHAWREPFPHRCLDASYQFAFVTESAGFAGVQQSA